ncbi:MAG: biotin--[acetyl-CoA-carboxylase] ligase, partial [Candidatus Omnitrophota bacterium]
VLAETQTKGRGRLGRGWSSPKHKGIYMSFILRPQIHPGLTPILTLLSAVSICQAVKEVTGLEIQIKWPNDIVVHTKKLGGILTELNAEMDEVRFIVIGIGLNVNSDKRVHLPSAISLKDIKKEDISRIELLQEILRNLEKNYLIFQKEGSQPVVERWRDYNITLGRRIKVFYHGKHLEAEAVDIDSDGGLLVRNDSGLIQKVTAGDIVHCR